jgi:hypothetical protein
MLETQDMEISSEPDKENPTPINSTTLTQEEATNINEIINEINNPESLQASSSVTENQQSNSPSNSPAKKKSKTSDADLMDSQKGSSQKKRTKKRSSQTATSPASALRASKYSNPNASEKENIQAPHDHKHKKILIELSIDFNKDSLSQFDGDNGKKMVFAIQHLLSNLKIADKFSVLNPVEDTGEPPLGGQTNNPVPSNMTALSNYIKGLNPRAFQASNRPTPASTDDTGPNTRRTGSLAYGVISIACDKDPELLVNQISYEWARFGNHLKIKELQAVETITPFAIYYVYALTHKQTLVDEQKEILKAAQKLMHQEDYFIDRDLPMRWGYSPLPLVSLRMNVPRIPKHSEPTNMSRLPSNIQTCRRVLHLEVDKSELELVTHLVQYAKKAGLYSKWWGNHAHPTEGVDWQSSPGDIRRAAKFAVKTTNYNASMTSIDVFGFLDLSKVIEVKKPGGTVAKLLTGRECLTSLFKFQDGSSLIAEAHQQVPLGSVSLVYPNIPEGEKLISGLAKQIAAFSRGHLLDLKVDEDFVQEFLKIFVDPQLIHEATHCQWDSSTQTLLTPSELEENTTSNELEEQGWWRDVVIQYDTTKGQGKRPFASPQALFDLDGTQSVKTMHEANDNASADPSQDSSKRVRIQETSGQEKSMSDASSSSVVSDEGRGGRRSGHTPKSVEVQEDEDSADMEYDSEEGSDSSTASAADPTTSLPGKTG